MPDPAEVTQLLIGCRQGDRQALDQLLPLVYDELRRLARGYLSRERAGHTLQPTALVHEAYLRLIGQQSVDWRNRAQFLGLAAQMMRRILVNHAEARQAAKRSRPEQDPWPEATALSESQLLDVLTLDRALVALHTLDPRQERIIELRYYAGLSLEETAEVMEISLATVKREWSIARLWIRQQLSGAEPPETAPPSGRHLK